MLEKLHIFISLFAALVVTVVSIFNGYSLAKMSFLLILSITLFYLVGVFVREYLQNKVFCKDKNNIDENSIKDDNEKEHKKKKA